MAAAEDATALRNTEREVGRTLEHVEVAETQARTPPVPLASRGVRRVRAGAVAVEGSMRITSLRVFASMPVLIVAAAGNARRDCNSVSAGS
jgi:hypothetical protein